MRVLGGMLCFRGSQGVHRTTSSSWKSELAVGEKDLSWRFGLG